MVRRSKQTRDRQVSPKRPKKPAIKSGPKKESLAEGFKAHPNTLQGEMAAKAFIPKF